MKKILAIAILSLLFIDVSAKVSQEKITSLFEKNKEIYRKWWDSEKNDEEINKLVHEVLDSEELKEEVFYYIEHYGLFNSDKFDENVEKDEKILNDSILAGVKNFTYDIVLRRLAKKGLKSKL